MTEIEININKYAQNKLTDSGIMDWIDQFDLQGQKEIRDKLIFFAQQAHPTYDLIMNSIQNARIKETVTPVVLLRTHSFKIAVNKIVELPDFELKKSIVILLSLVKTADIHRRETDCKNGCSHAWHNMED